MRLRPPRPVSVAVGKAARTLTRLRGGSGSAFPGLVVEKIDPSFLARTLAQLPLGVVVVSGTNGKTTTTKMVVELLRGQGLKVFTNRSGSNFTRGVVASLLGETGLSGRLDADIAVLELDEAHAVHFVRAVKPQYALLLNVMRDQLDRFGEIDTTAALLRTVAQATTEAVVLNREDARVAGIADSLAAQDVRYFGLAPKLRSHFPSDETCTQPPQRSVMRRRLKPRLSSCSLRSWQPTSYSPTFRLRAARSASVRRRSPRSSASRGPTTPTTQPQL